MNSQTNLLSCPREILIEIFLFLSARDIITLSRVSKYIRLLSENNIIWRHLTRIRCPQTSYKREDETLKEFYKRFLFYFDVNNSDCYKNHIVSNDSKTIKCNNPGWITNSVNEDFDYPIKEYVFEMVKSQGIMIGVSTSKYYNSYPGSGNQRISTSYVERQRINKCPCAKCQNEKELNSEERFNVVYYESLGKQKIHFDNHTAIIPHKLKVILNLIDKWVFIQFGDDRFGYEHIPEEYVKCKWYGIISICSIDEHISIKEVNKLKYNDLFHIKRKILGKELQELI